MEEISEIRLLAKWTLECLENREEDLIKETRSLVRKLLERLQTQLPEGKVFGLRGIEVEGKKAAWILMKDEVVYREIETRRIIDRGTIEDFVNTDWFSLGLAKSILSRLINYQLLLVEDQ